MCLCWEFPSRPSRRTSGTTWPLLDARLLHWLPGIQAKSKYVNFRWWMIKPALICMLSFLVVEINTGEGNGNPLQYSCLENSTDRGFWQAIVLRIIRVKHKLATKPPLLNVFAIPIGLGARNIQNPMLKISCYLNNWQDKYLLLWLLLTLWPYRRVPYSFSLTVHPISIQRILLGLETIQSSSSEFVKLHADSLYVTLSA